MGFLEDIANAWNKANTPMFTPEEVKAFNTSSAKKASQKFSKTMGQYQAKGLPSFYAASSAYRDTYGNDLFDRVRNEVQGVTFGTISTPLRLVTEQATAMNVAINLAMNNPQKYFGNPAGFKDLFNRSRELAYGNRDGREWWQHGEENVTLGQSMYSNYFNYISGLLKENKINLNELSTEDRAHYFDSNAAAKYVSGFYDIAGTILLDPINYLGGVGVAKRAINSRIPIVQAYTREPGFLDEGLAQVLNRQFRIHPYDIMPGVPRASSTLLAENELKLLTKDRGIIEFGAQKKTVTRNPFSRKPLEADIINEDINNAFFVGTQEYDDFVNAMIPKAKPFRLLPARYANSITPFRLKNGDINPYVEYIYSDGEFFAIRQNKDSSVTLFREVPFKPGEGRKPDLFFGPYSNSPIPGIEPNTISARWEKVKYLPQHTRAKIEKYPLIEEYTTPGSFAQDVLAQQSESLRLPNTGEVVNRSQYLYDISLPRKNNLSNIKVKESTGFSKNDLLPEDVRFIMVKDLSGKPIRIAVSSTGETWVLGQYNIRNLVKPKSETPSPQLLSREEELNALIQEQAVEMGNEKFLGQMEAQGFVDTTTGEIIDFDAPELSDIFRREFTEEYDNLWGEYGEAESFNRTQETLGSSYTMEGETVKPKTVPRTGVVWVKQAIDPKKVSEVEHVFINPMTGETSTAWISGEYRLTNADAVANGSMPLFKKGEEIFTVDANNNMIPFSEYTAHFQEYQSYINKLEKFSASYIGEQQRAFDRWRAQQLADRERENVLAYNIETNSVERQQAIAGKPVPEQSTYFPTSQEVLDELQVTDPVRYQQLMDNAGNENINVYFEGVKTSDGGLDVVLKRHHRSLDSDFTATGDEYEVVLGSWHLTPEQANALDSFAARTKKIRPLKDMFEFGRNKSGNKVVNKDTGREEYPLEEFNKTSVSTTPKDIQEFGMSRQFKNVRSVIAQQYDALEEEIAKLNKNIARAQMTINNAVSNKFGSKTVESQRKVLEMFTAERDALVEQHKTALAALVDSGWANSTDPQVASWLAYSQTKVVPYYEGYLQRMLDILNEKFGTSVRVWDDIEREYVPYRAEEFVVDAETKRIADEAVARGEAKGRGETVVEPTTKSAVNKIDLFRGENSFLSNMFDSPITVRGETYPTAEHAFQAAKFTDKTKRDAIAAAKSPAEAKKLGRQSGMRSDWNEKRILVMEEILRAKFEQNPDLMKKLVATGDAELIEGNTWGDKFWGQVNGEGENNLGKILMKLREEFKSGSSVVEPATINPTRPEPDEIFVFGSNLEGRHGAGAAKFAKDNFGAEYGNPSGPQGQSYAIPTKDLKTNKGLSLSEIKNSIEEFLKYAETNPDKKFFFSAIGTGLAGHSPTEIASLISRKPSNVRFDPKIGDLINTSKSTTKVARVKDVDLNDPDVQYVGRAGRGQVDEFGNPFVVGKDGTLKQVLKKYDNWLTNEVRTNPEYARKVYALKGKTLACPGREPNEDCHAQSIVKAIEFLDNNPKYLNDVPTSATQSTGEVVIHSGGARGSDSVFARYASELGIETQAHSFAGHKLSNDSISFQRRVVHSQEELAQADELLKKVHLEYLYKNRSIPSDLFKKNLLRRNYFQIKDSDAVIAVGTFGADKEVLGGTGWAVYMGIELEKPVYFFDLNLERWYQMDKVSTWTLDKGKLPPKFNSFAGIGTRDINDAGKQAIKDYLSQFESQIKQKPTRKVEG